MDENGRITDWWPGAAAVFGYNADEIIGRSAGILFAPEDRDAGEDKKEIETARSEGCAPNVRWHLCKGGSRVFIEGTIRALSDSDGNITGFLKIGQDVTKRKEWSGRQQVLLSELQHRTRNLLGVVRRIGDQTLRSSKDLSDFGPKFRQRISALARVQTLVSRLDEDERVTFDHLIESELSALGDHHEYVDKVTLEGPAGVALPSSAVQILALAIHELCTNALKYGALRQAHGRLSIAWKIKEDDPQWLHVDWRETGIEIRPDAMSRVRGSGRDLIEHALPYQLKAKTSFTIEPDGIHCTILVPISEETLRGCDYD